MGAAAMVAVPSIESTVFTVKVVADFVFTPPPERVRLL